MTARTRHLHAPLREAQRDAMRVLVSDIHTAIGSGKTFTELREAIGLKPLSVFPGYPECPDSVRDSIDAYVVSGRPCGDFVTAVLANDLLEACVRADDVNMWQIRGIGAYVFERVPTDCYGSYPVVEEWIRLHHLSPEDLTAEIEARTLAIAGEGGDRD